MRLKNIRILITAGPTWAAIDSVRVISNRASGRTGILLAEGFRRLGARVTLLLGPVGCHPLERGIRVLRFSFFEELQRLMEGELKAFNYDAVIHSAAVSDYRLPAPLKRKICSGIKGWELKLSPTPKIISCIKKISPSSIAVGFKFEPEAKKSSLVREAKRLMRAARLDLAVANTITAGRYRAYLVSPQGAAGKAFGSREAMARELVSLVGAGLGGKADISR